MEPKSYMKLRMRIPPSVCGDDPEFRSCLQGPRKGLTDADRDKEKSSHKKTVTLAPTSKYLTEKSQYTVRKPLFVTESHISILKKLPRKGYFDQEIRPVTGCDEDCLLPGDMECLFKSQAEDSQWVPPAEHVALSAIGGEWVRSMTVTELKDRPSPGEIISSGGSSQACLSSPALDTHSLTEPLCHRKTYIQRRSPLKAHNLSLQFANEITAGVQQDQLVCTSLNSSSSLHSDQFLPLPIRLISPSQANYWSCAIPQSLPPSPNRRSPTWDPDKEYQALLDYTYPLKPNMSYTEHMSLLQTDPALLDSGIELDQLCSSTSLRHVEKPVVCGRRGSLKVRHGGLEPECLLDQKHLLHYKSLDSKLYSNQHSSVDQMGGSQESVLDCEYAQTPQWSHCHEHSVFSSSKSAPTSCILPCPGGSWDGEEEFRSLPVQVRELQLLSQQLRSISLQVKKPHNASCESLGKGASCVKSPTMLVKDRSAEGPSLGKSVCGASSSLELFGEAQGLGCSLQSLRKEVNRDNLRAVASCMDHLSGASLAEFQKRTDVDQTKMETENKESLLHHIESFCSRLEELILWLYKVVEKMEGLTPPTADIASVKSCLADYKNFQREVSVLQPLTAAVMHTGEVLLCCMDSISPVLKETLALIKRQSRALESHTDRLFSSILLAMDSQPEAGEPSMGNSPQLSESVVGSAEQTQGQVITASRSK